MLDLEVSPEEGLQHDLWEFVLGMHFSQAVAIVQSQVRVVKAANVIYNDQTPLSTDLILDLPADGFRLIFDSRSQRLKLLEIYNLKLVRLKYCGTLFNGSEVIPTVHQIDRCFGATRPGTFDKEKGVFALNFRGLSFYFPVDSQFQPHYSHGLGSLRFPGEATPVLSRVVIYQGNSSSSAGLDTPIIPPLPHSLFRGQVFCEDCRVLRNPGKTRSLGLALTLTALATKGDVLEVDEGEAVTFHRSIYFGESSQSIAAKLGTPTKVYYKCDDKMKIHSKEAHRRVSSEKSDYFFNYFTIGVDILFEAASNRAVKFVLHTNFPGHYDFTDYHRCPFSFTMGRDNQSGGGGIIDLMGGMDMNPKKKATNPVNKKVEQEQQQEEVKTEFTEPKGKGKKKNKNNGNKKGQSSSSSSEKSSPPSEEAPPPIPQTTTTTMTPTTATSLDLHWDTRWEEIRNFLWSEKATTPTPVVLTRSSASNPFGPSLCYGVQDLIFEVMSNDHLATVTVYSTGMSNNQEDDLLVDMMM